ncbi:MAG: hypothetical protein ACO33B_01695 [Ilumatobacteraceae bacterium]
MTRQMWAMAMVRLLQQSQRWILDLVAPRGPYLLELRTLARYLMTRR